MAQRAGRGDGFAEEDGDDLGQWRRELDGHRPHSWMVLLMSLYDVCAWQGRWVSDPGASLPLPRKADTYLLYGLRKSPADFSRDIDQPRNWLVDNQLLRRSLFLGDPSASRGGKTERVARLVDLSASALSTVWPRFRALSRSLVRSGRPDPLAPAEDDASRAATLEAVRSDGVLLDAVASLLPDVRPTLDAVGRVAPGALGRRLADHYARVMQVAGLSRVVGTPACMLGLLDLLDARGYATELAGDFPDVSYVSFAGISADFGLEAILQRAAEAPQERGGRLSACVMCALAELSAIGPLRLAELAEGGPDALARPSSALAAYRHEMDGSDSGVAPSTVVLGVERAGGRRRDALTLAQVAYESYEGPLDARGAVVPSHAPIPLEEGKVYYLGRQVSEDNFGSEDERRAFLEDERLGRAVLVEVRPATKTSVARVHAKVSFDPHERSWVLQALRNRAASQRVPARTLVIDPNDRVLDATLVRRGWSGRSVDRTVRALGERDSARLRASSVLWLGPKLVESADGSARWAPDEVRGVVFVLRGE